MALKCYRMSTALLINSNGVRVGELSGKEETDNDWFIIRFVMIEKERRHI